METYTPGIIRDMTDSFISAYKKEMAKETGKDIGSIDDIQGLMVDVVFAGSDRWFGIGEMHDCFYSLNIFGKITRDTIIGCKNNNNRM